MTHELLALALEGQAKDRRLTAAFDAIVAAYYEEYTDAEELDGDFYAALKTVFDVCFPSGETEDGREFHDVIAKDCGRCVR